MTKQDLLGVLKGLDKLFPGTPEEIPASRLVEELESETVDAMRYRFLRERFQGFNTRRWDSVVADLNLVALPLKDGWESPALDEIVDTTMRQV
jgi:hypothetical protein